MYLVGDCFVAKLPRCSGEAIIETGGDLDTSESDGEVEVRPVFFSSFLESISSYLLCMNDHLKQARLSPGETLLKQAFSPDFSKVGQIAIILKL